MQDFNGVFKDLLSRLNRVERRLNALEAFEYTKIKAIPSGSDYLIHATIVDGTTYTSSNLRGTGGIGAIAQGFIGTLWITPIVATTVLQITPGDDTPGAYSQQYKWMAAGIGDYYNYSQFIMCPLGADGDIRIKAVGADTEVFIVTFGYWG